MNAVEKQKNDRLAMSYQMSTDLSKATILKTMCLRKEGEISIQLDWPWAAYWAYAAVDVRFQIYDQFWSPRQKLHGSYLFFNNTPKRVRLAKRVFVLWCFLWLFRSKN